MTLGRRDGPIRASAVPEGFADGFGAGDRHLRRGRLAILIIGALTIDEAVVAHPPGAIVEQKAPAGLAVVRHEQDRAGVDFIIARHRRRFRRREEFDRRLPRGKPPGGQHSRNSGNRRDPAPDFRPAASPLHSLLRALHGPQNLARNARLRYPGTSATNEHWEIRWNRLSGGDPARCIFPKSGAAALLRLACKGCGSTRAEEPTPPPGASPRPP